MTSEHNDSTTPATPLSDCTAFQRNLMAVVVQLPEKPHGLAIKEALTSHYENGINHGRLYSNLNTLVDRELIEKGRLDERTNYYQLTQRGKRELAADYEWRS